MRRMRRLPPRLIAAPLAALLALPATGCTTGRPATLDLARAGCPADIRILTDSAPRVEQGALFHLLGESNRVYANRHSISAPLTVDGASTGVRLTILFATPMTGRQPLGSMPTTTCCSRRSTRTWRSSTPTSSPPSPSSPRSIATPR